MQWSLVAVILIVNALFGASCASAENGKGQISYAFEAFGYSPACVASALTSCEFSSTKELSVDVVDSIEETKSLLQEMKSEIKVIRQEMKSVEENSSSAVKPLLQEMMSEIKAIRQEMKSAEKNSSSVVKTTAAPEGKELPKNCADLKVLGDELSGGVQTVYPYLPNQKSVVVYCDQVTDGGGWTVIQSRSPLPIRENFNRNWDEYAEGFGDPNGEFWIGLDNIHALTNSTQMSLRVDLETAEGEKAWAKYGTFHVGDAASEYVISIEGYTGDAGDGMTYPGNKDYNINGMKFSTQDKDNDFYSGNCGEIYKGGWWFNICEAAHLNGLPIVGVAFTGRGIRWVPLRGSQYSMKKADMKIRPVSLGF